MGVGELRRLALQLARLPLVVCSLCIFTLNLPRVSAVTQFLQVRAWQARGLCRPACDAMCCGSPSVLAIQGGPEIPWA